MRSNLLLREHAHTLEIRDAVPRPRTFDAERLTIEAVIASTTPVARRDAAGEFMEVLQPQGLDRAASRGASVLDSHHQGGLDAVLGTLDDIRIEGDEVIGVIRFSTRSERAPIIADIRSGIIAHLSVGYLVAEWRDSVDAQGRRTRTAVKWTIREASFVSVPADPRARTRALDRLPARADVNRHIRTLVAAAGRPVRVADDLIDRGSSIEEARGELYEDFLIRGASPMRASVGTDYADPDVQARAISDAIYSKMTGAAASGAARELVHRSAIDLMGHWAAVNGITLRSNAPNEVYGAVMSTRASGMHSTSDFPTLLADNMNRRLGELFKAAESGASAIAAPGTARDFRPITEARMTSFPSLEPVGENGEIKWGTLGEEGEKLVIGSHARAIGVTFQVIINDDLSAIDRSIRDIGFATAQLKAKLIVAALSAKLVDGLPLFDEEHRNLAISGSNGPPDETTLSAGRVALMKQTPPGSTEPLGLSPSILLVPAELQTASEKLVAAINPSSSDNVNVFAGKLSVAVEPRLPDALQWFLFCAPGTYPVIRFLTLAGFEGPRFETSEEFSRLGTSFRVHWHCGAGPIDFRGAWKNEG